MGKGIDLTETIGGCGSVMTARLLNLNGSTERSRIMHSIFVAAISQHAAEPHPPRIIERHDAIVDEISRGDGRLAIIELGEGDLGVGVDKGLLVDAAD